MNWVHNDSLKKSTQLILSQNSFVCPFVKLSLHRLKPWKGGGNVVTRIIVGYTSFGFWADCGLALHTGLCDTILTPYTQFGAFDSSRCHTRCKVNLAVTQEILTFVGKHPFLLFVCMMVSAFLQWPQDASDAIYVVSHSYDICLVTSKKDQPIKL